MLARACALAVSAGKDALQPLGLTARAFATLTLAAERDGLTQREISDFLRLDPSRVVGIVDDLESRGFVSRLVGSGDRRMKAVVATLEGRALFEQAVEATRGAERGLFEGLAPDVRAAAIRLLQLLAFPAQASPREPPQGRLGPAAREARPQFGLAHFPGRRARQIVDDDDALWDLVPHYRAGEVLAHGFDCDGCLGRESEHRAGHLAPPVVGDADDGRTGDSVDRSDSARSTREPVAA